MKEDHPDHSDQPDRGTWPTDHPHFPSTTAPGPSYTVHVPMTTSQMHPQHPLHQPAGFPFGPDPLNRNLLHLSNLSRMYLPREPYYSYSLPGSGLPLGNIFFPHGGPVTRQSPPTEFPHPPPAHLPLSGPSIESTGGFSFYGGEPRPTGGPRGLVPFHRPLGAAQGSQYSRGTLVQLAGGSLRTVEELCENDFRDSIRRHPDLNIDRSEISGINKDHVKGTVKVEFVVGSNKKKVVYETDVAHPFWVVNRGWSSSDPDKTLAKYNLPCRSLQLEDVCLTKLRNTDSQSQQSTSRHNRTDSIGPSISSRHIRHSSTALEGASYRRLSHSPSESRLQRSALVAQISPQMSTSRTAGHPYIHRSISRDKDTTDSANQKKSFGDH